MAPHLLRFGNLARKRQGVGVMIHGAGAQEVVTGFLVCLDGFAQRVKGRVEVAEPAQCHAERVEHRCLIVP
jgi:hypothetical protein